MVSLTIRIEIIRRGKLSYTVQSISKLEFKHRIVEARRAYAHTDSLFLFLFRVKTVDQL